VIRLETQSLIATLTRFCFRRRRIFYRANRRLNFSVRHFSVGARSNRKMLDRKMEALKLVSAFESNRQIVTERLASHRSEQGARAPIDRRERV
jgi:hypothetical protein